MLRQALLLLLILVAAPVAAQDESRFTLGGDTYFAGRIVTANTPVQGDLFAMGSRVTVRGSVAGTAHLLGRSLDVDERIGGNLYAAGMRTSIDAPVAGNVSVMGNSVFLSDAVSGNLRAMGSEVTVAGPVAGSAILGGEIVLLDAEISGDVALSAATVEWGEAARVGGILHVYTDDADEVDIPGYVVPAERVEFHAVDTWEDDTGEALENAKPGFWAGLGSLLGGVILTALVATLVAALAPNFTQSLREGALASPLRSLWMGALGLATASGAAVVLAITGIGIFAAPLAVALAVLLGFAGYVTGAYLLGVWALDAAGRGLPDSTLDRALAALLGALILALVVMIPFIGWLAVFAVLLIGVGGLMIRLFAPAFFTGERA